MKYVVTFLLSFLVCFSVHSQQFVDNLKDSVVKNMYVQLNVYPQEKVHLHLDRELYAPTERIWFKAYLVDAFYHQHMQQSRYVYAELISPTDSLISRVMLFPQEDLHHGYIDIPEGTPEGYYTVRAYTKYMQNQGEDYFYRKKIHIVPMIGRQSAAGKDIKPDKKKRDKEDYEVYFLPEGGNYLAGEKNIMAFKVLDEKGNPESITGKIVDSQGEELTEINTYHAGMGFFPIFNQQGERYFLHCSNSKGQHKVFELPNAQLNAHSLNCVFRRGILHLTRLHSADVTPGGKYYILAHCKGQVLYFDSWNDDKILPFRLERLPAGIIQFMLFDEQMNVLSERLFFSKNYKLAPIEFHTDKQVYESRGLVKSTLKLTGEEGAPLSANMSVAITDDKDFTFDQSSGSILTSLLLTSELKGYIESPGYYFEEDDVVRSRALDCLMMTHGWRRYHIPDVVKGTVKRPEIPAELSQTISGRVKSLILGKPIVNSEVTLLSLHGLFDVTKADEHGRFAFTGFEQPDSTRYVIQSLGKRGGTRVELILDKLKYPEVHHLPHPKADSSDTLSYVYTDKVEYREKYDEQMRMIYLDEVQVTAKSIDPKEKDMPWFSSSSDHTVSREAIEKRGATDVYQLLFGIAGVVVSGDQISIRGGGTPALYVDGVNYDMDMIDMIPVTDIERIDVFKGASTALFGSHGGNGVISIVTRSGEVIRDDRELFNVKVISPLGVQKPAEFYAPRYESKVNNVHKPDLRTTIFWKPDIVTDEEGKANFDFYTADFNTTYTVVIEGLTTDGRIIRTVEKMRVGNEGDSQIR